MDKAATLCNSFLTEKLSLLLPGDTIQSSVTYSVIQDELPVLATLMENGRMSSIGESVLNKWESTEPVDESAIVIKTIKSYMSSNGMKKLPSSPESMRLVAASVLAVHLFQWRREGADKYSTPTNRVEYQEFMTSMKCGVTFVQRVDKMIGTTGSLNAMQRIVGKYGLLYLPESLPMQEGL